MGTVITEPGVYELSDADYHGDPVPGGSLSSSGARLLLPPSCPARYAHQRDHPPTPTREFDLGHAAHRVVLGVGPELVVVEAADWRTKAAREARDQAHADGRVPLLPHQFAQITDMVHALRQHPIARVLLDPQLGGEAEQTLVWRDQRTQVMCRARVDWLRQPTAGRLILVDYKTADSAERGAFARAVAAYGYHIQDGWYCDGADTLNLAGDVQFVFVVQEKQPPYLVNVIQLDDEAQLVGRAAGRRAREMYRDCTTTGIWPGYSSEVELVALPRYAIRRYDEETW